MQHWAEPFSRRFWALVWRMQVLEYGLSWRSSYVIKKINASVAVKNDTGTDIVIRFDGFERVKAVAKEANKLGEK